MSNYRKTSNSPTFNWYVVGGIILAGIAFFGVLIWSGLQSGGPFALDTYCAENASRCIEKGNADAVVKIYEIYDYGCPACQGYAMQYEPQVMSTLVDTGEVYYVRVPFALGDATALSVQGAFCAEEQGKFEEWHYNVFATMVTSHEVPQDRMVKSAETVGMDTTAFEECLASNRYADTVGSNISKLSSLGVNSTPTFFVNGSKLVGVQTPQDLAREVETAKAVLRGK
ncbi:MAG TPA: thioredoxin domain-containing protein [Anaerolineales bacterium]|nr:thioredoxin domain-containing protein [Anaerolineales bacterium]